MGPLVALMLAAAPATVPSSPPARPGETAISVGLGSPGQGAGMGLGLSLARRPAPDGPAAGRTRLVYRLEVRTTEAGFPRWIEARLSLTEGGSAPRSPELGQPERPGPFATAVACVLRWLQPRQEHLFTFIGATGERPLASPAEANVPPRLTLGLGVEF